jgi:hypothetical protein
MRVLPFLVVLLGVTSLTACTTDPTTSLLLPAACALVPVIDSDIVHPDLGDAVAAGCTIVTIGGIVTEVAD